MDLNPTIPQDDFIFSEAQFPAMVSGFGAGKTEALIARCLIHKIRYPECDVAFYEPTYDLIRMIAWPRFEAMLSDLKVPYILTRHPINLLTIRGAGRIHFRSMDTPSRIVGYEVADSFVDELDTLKTDDAAYVWRQIVARNRQKKPDGSKNTIAVATTPEGFRFVYQTWEANPAKGYEIIRASTTSNPHLPADYVDSLRAIYPANLLEAYIEGRFVNLTSGQVYTSFSRAKNHADARIEQREPLHIGMDFNVGQMSAVIHVKRDRKPVAVGEITKALDTPHMIRLIQDRFPDHQISVYPDASGGGRRSNNAATTDLKLLREAGFSVYAPKANPPVRDRINSMNAAFERGGYMVNTDACPEYTKCLEQQAYDKHGDPDKAQGLDHLCFSGDTLVQTNAGLVRFDKMPESGFVLSPHGGWIRYRNAGKTGENVTMSVSFSNGYMIKCTPDHLFLVEDGRWIPAKDLKGLRCVLSVQQSRFSKDGLFTLAASIFRIPTGQGKSGYIGQYGNITWGKFLMGSMSTTLMATAATIRSRIWPVFLPLTTFLAIPRLPAGKECGGLEASLGIWRQNGTDRRKAASGTGCTMRKCVGSFMSGCLQAVITAGKCIRQQFQLLAKAQGYFVAGNARQHGGGRQELTTLTINATNAAGHFRPTNTTRCVTALPVDLKDTKKEPVYCLTVDGVGAFRLTEKSPVVSNCDAGGYFIHYEYPLVKPAKTISLRSAY